MASSEKKTVLGGRYALGPLLGRGGFGEVYAAEDRLGGGRRVAVKFLRDDLFSKAAKGDRRPLEELKNEYRQLARLRHPGVAEVLDLGIEEETGRRYLVTEFAPGEDIVAAAASGADFTLIEDLLAQILAALSYVHDRGVLHLDLKAENIVVCRTPRGPAAKILDFGLARGAEAAAAGLTGSVHYMAPEVIRGEKPDRRADLYSAGVLAYRLAAGRFPFEGNSPSEILKAHLEGEAPPLGPASLAPPYFGGFLKRLLARSPDERYPDARTALDDLSLFAGRVFPAGPVWESYLYSGELIGREAQLAVLEGALEEVRQGNASRFLLLEGPEGAGKTRLLEELARRARLGLLKVEELSGTNFADAFDDLMERLDPDYAPPPRPESLDAAARRDLAGQLASRLLGVIHRGLLLVVDDLDKLGDFASEVLAVLAREARYASFMEKAPRILCAASRTTGGTRKASELDGLFEKIDAGPFTPEETARYVAYSTGVEAVPPELAERLHEKTGGLPFLLRETLGALFARGYFFDEEGRWDVSRLADLDLDLNFLGAPASAAELLERRAAALPPAWLAVLEAASVFGRPFRAEEAAPLLETPNDEMREILDRLVAADFLEAREELYDFSQGLMAQVAYRRMDSEKRCRMHDLAAATLREEERDDEEVWRHLARGSDPLEAVENLERLADSYAQRAAFGRSEAAYRELLERFERKGGRERRRAAVWCKLGKLLTSMGRSEEAEGIFEDALELLGEGGEAPLTLDLLTQIGLCRLRLGKTDGALAYFDEGLALAAREHPRERAALLNYRGHLFLSLKRYQEALESFEEARAAAALLPLSERSRLPVGETGLAWHYLGDLEKAVNQCLEDLAECRASRNRRAEARCLSNLAQTRFARGEYEEAARCYRRCAEMAGEEGLVPLRSSALSNLGVVLEQIGDYAGAVECQERCLAIARRAGDKVREAQRIRSLGALHSLAGAFDRAERYLLLALDLDDGESPTDRCETLMLLGDLERARRNGYDARKYFEEADRLAGDAAPHRRRWILYGLAELAFDEGRPAEALDLVEACRREARDGEESYLQRCRLLEGKALVALKDAPDAKVQELLTGAAAHFDQTGERELLWEARHFLALYYHKRGEVDGALRESGAAAELIETTARLQPPENRRAYLDAPHRREAIEFRRELRSRLGPGADVEALERYCQSLNAVLEINRRLLEERNAEFLLRLILSHAMDLSRAERGIVIMREEGGGLSVRVTRNIEPEELRLETEFSKALARKVFDKGEFVLTDNASLDERFREYASVQDLHLRSVLALPIKLGARVLGVLYLDHRFRQSVFGETDLKALLAFGDQAALALDNARLHEENERYRRRLEEKLEKTTEIVETQQEELKDYKELVAESQSRLETRYNYENIVARSRQMLELFKILDKVTDTSMPVLVCGESGTGKELIAKALHYNGPRKKARFMAINCGAVPETLLESELFGYVKGSFTGADRDKKGLFESADDGTVFLDEIADMSLGMQQKLLRVIQEHEITRIGSHKPVPVDVRIISASNRDLAGLKESGEFREDLYYRISTISLSIPPLRERREDIPLLVEHLVQKICRTNSIPVIPRVTAGALRVLMEYDWPGNIRQLENVLASACTIAEKGAIDQGVLTLHRELGEFIRSVETPFSPGAEADGDGEDIGYGQAKEAFEKAMIEAALKKNRGRRTATYKELGMSKATFFRKLKKYGIN